MEKLAFCGLDCTNCDAFKATKNGDEAKKAELAAAWSFPGNELKASDIYCDGDCTSREGKHLAWCDKCEIRKCGFEHEVENCAYCTSFPCDKVEKMWEHAPQARENLMKMRGSNN